MALIYVVDDDDLVLTSLRMLIEVETPHEVVCFANPRVAVDALAVRPPDVVLSDLSMPGMTGIDVLSRARIAVPDGARILLTAYADKDSAIRAINVAGIFQLVEKPWSNDELLAALATAVEHVALRRELKQTIDELTGRNHELEHALAELRDAQDRLVSSERLAAVGRLATGIAHEIGNQLSLLGYAELIAERYAHDPEARKLTDPLLAAKRRMASMVASIREYVRGQGQDRTGGYARESQPLVPIIEETLSILRFEPAMKLRRIERRPLDLEARATVNSEKLLQVTINLVRNAIQATREGGLIRVGVARRGDEVILEVQDDGVGIPADKHEKIFEAFYSTKGEGGTGLGLGICRRIIEEHGGRITVASEPDHGATFTVVLPNPQPAG